MNGHVQVLSSMTTIIYVSYQVQLYLLQNISARPNLTVLAPALLLANGWTMIIKLGLEQ